MVLSLPFNSLPSARLSAKLKPPLLIKPQLSHFFLPKCPTRQSTLHPSASASHPSDRPKPQKQQQVRTLFPGGFKLPEIKVPTLALRLTADEVLGRQDDIDAAMSKGVGIAILEGGDEGGGRLYEAACVLRSVIGDRPYFLIAERVDIAAAVGASGVLLSDEGIPTIVAKNMMMKSRSDSVYLPLVARSSQTESSALNEASVEGADFLIMRGEDYAKVLENSVSQHVKLPIFVGIYDLVKYDISNILLSGACGIITSLDGLKHVSDDFVKEIFFMAHGADRIMHDRYSNSSKLVIDNVKIVVNGKKRIAGFTKLDDKEIQLMEAEKVLLDEVVAVIRKSVPMMKEVALLLDATSRLNEPFLLVIVGEFNSGKSTVINALLGRRYLKDGVIPTTNEISLLRYSETDSHEQERCERHPDGQFICNLSAPILKEMNLVDTPGTNVILQRQQQITEEFVPRADLILFVISSDRPLTESEVSFLIYLQQWKKKVVFVLNKMDLYQNTSELEEATAFIKENTWKLLNTEDVRLYPVSARSALEAKLSASNNNGGNYEEILANDPHWINSRFYELEEFLFSFLDGSTETGIERVRLKLETPIGIADRLLTSCEKLVNQEYEDANQGLISISEVLDSVEEYAKKVENESISWKKHALSLIESAKSRAVNLMESILQLSNIDLIATYAFNNDRSGSTPATSIVQNEIISPALSDVQRLLGDYAKWLQSNNAREWKLYMEHIKQRWHAFADLNDWAQSEPFGLLCEQEELSITVIENFSVSTAARVFEQEIREVVLATFGGLGAAGLSASLLTSVLPTTLEDLLALALCSSGGLLTISNFPTRRKEAIEKVEKVADSIACNLEAAMQKDLMQTTGNLKHFLDVVSKPYEEAAQQRINRLLKIQDELSNVERKLQAMKIEIQNLHVSPIHSILKTR